MRSMLVEVLSQTFCTEPRKKPLSRSGGRRTAIACLETQARVLRAKSLRKKVTIATPKIVNKLACRLKHQECFSASILDSLVAVLAVSRSDRLAR